MDTTLTLTLGISILINILTLRWAYREHAARRSYQQETKILRQALRGVHPDNRSRADGFDHVIAWLLAGVFLTAVIWWIAG
jgi:hypothetical protein